MRITKKSQFFSTFYLGVRYDTFARLADLVMIILSYNYHQPIATKQNTLYLIDVISVVKTIMIANFS